VFLLIIEIAKIIVLYAEHEGEGGGKGDLSQHDKEVE
jgi:hypothetical protein